jgi:nucleotide-binding universal stress UspA family protein
MARLTDELERPLARPGKAGPDPPFGTIVCGVDEGESSRFALRVAADLSKCLSAELVLVHVAPRPVIPGASEVSGASEELRSVEEQHALELLEKLQAVEQLESDVAYYVLFGSPATALDELARREDVGLIVVGSSRRRSLRSAVLGSVSMQLAKSAPCPVLVVPPEDSSSEPTR